MPTSKLFILGLLAGLLCSGRAKADAVRPHHSVSIHAMVTEAGKNGEMSGHTIRTITTASIIKWAIKQNGDSSIKPSELDLVEDDASGTIDVINRTSLDAGFLFQFATGYDATETTGFSTTEPTGYTQYRVYNNFYMYTPNEGHTALINITFTSHLDHNSAFKNGSAVFSGGTDPNDTFQYVIKGTITTGNRKFTY